MTWNLKNKESQQTYKSSFSLRAAVLGSTKYLHFMIFPDIPFGGLHSRLVLWTEWFELIQNKIHGCELIEFNGVLELLGNHVIRQK